MDESSNGHGEVRPFRQSLSPEGSRQQEEALAFHRQRADALREGRVGETLTPPTAYSYDNGYGPPQAPYQPSPVEALRHAQEQPFGVDVGHSAAPSYIEIEVEGDGRDVGLRFKDGSLVEIHVPPLTMGKIAKLGWFQTQVEKRSRELNNCTNIKQVDHFANRVTAAQRDQIMFMVPEFPSEWFTRLQAGSFYRLVGLFDTMTKEAMGQATGDSDADEEGTAGNA